MPTFRNDISKSIRVRSSQTSDEIDEIKTGRSPKVMVLYLRPTGRIERDFSQGCVVIGQGGMTLNYKRADLD